MWKKTLCVIAAVVTALFALPVCSAEDTTLYCGDTVQYIFTIGECENVAGISVNSVFSTKYLELSDEPEFLMSLQGMTNTKDEGSVKWNLMMSGGRAFANDDVFVETFTVKKKCTLEDAKLSFECTELFSHDLQMLPTELLTARVEVLATGSDDDSEPPESSELTSSSALKPQESSEVESHTDSKPESEPVSSSPSSRDETVSTRSIKPVTIYSTDLADLEEDDVDPTVSHSATTTSRTRRSTTSSHLPYVRPTSSMIAAANASAQGASSAASSSSATDTEASSSSEASSSTASVTSSETSAEPSTISSALTSSETSSESTSSTKPSGKRNPLPALIAAIAAATITAITLSLVLKKKEEE